MPRPLKLKDSLGRDMRYAPPRDDGKLLVLSDDDLFVFELLDDHPVLPVRYLYELGKHRRKNYTHFQKRLKELCSRKKHAFNTVFLHRPKAQWASFSSLYQGLCYANTDAARAALGTWLTPARFDHMRHQLMCSTVPASMRIATLDTGIEYYPLRKMVEHERFPKSTRDAANPLILKVAKGNLIPDELSALRYQDGTFRFLAWEMDRSTETMADIEYKFHGYIDALTNRTYLSTWGTTSMMVLIVTTSSRRMANMMDLLGKMTRNSPELRHHFAFKYKEIYADDEWVTPDVMPDVLTDPWSRVELPPLFLDRA